MVIFITMGCNIYKITNKKNKKSYIGCTIKSIEDRFREHVSRCKKRKSKICDALKKYGKDGFILEQIDSCDNVNKMYELEKFYINKHDTYNKGYNLTIGGEGCIGYTHSDEVIQLTSKGRENGFTHKDLTYEEIYGKDSKKQKEKRSKSVKDYWSNISDEEKKRRVDKVRNTIIEKGSCKCGKNGFSKYIIIEGITYDCWSQAEEKLDMSKYKIKKTYKVEIKDKK
jgi:group I intron endonuclease